MNLRNLLVATATAAALSCTAGFAVPATAAAQTQNDDFHAMFNCATYPSNRPVTRSETLIRAQSWIDARVPYSQGACHNNQYGNYRADCSGFISMIWGLTYSNTTHTMHNVSHVIPRSELQPGDALNDAAAHIALFIGWDDAAKTRPRVREQAGPNGAATVERVWSAATAAGYTPIRYNNIVDDAAAPSGSSLSGDGKSEIATVLANGDVKAWRNYHGFANSPWDAEAVIATGFSPENAHFADLDGDGDKEIITVLANGDVKAWRNGRGFANSPWDGEAIIASGFTNQNVQFADLDGDRKAEIVTVLPNGDVKAWHNYHGFTSSPWDNEAIIATGFTPEGLHFADFDGNGKADIVAVLPNGDVKAWRNYHGFANSPWDNDAIVATGFTNQSLHFADLDGDRKSEIVTVLPNGDVKAWHNYHGFANSPWDNDAVIATGFTNQNLFLI